ncbi:hypothetical protein FOL47_001343 [Perkinsus chesapeaki]|uniref:GTP 3',8-cyclase n=1 Tax=Perkinsus chesapeaki TaxID=330153 RepID=A0A7J6MJL1_PERCH|nr:hypothetical protein FOL47_001343 [Perkinsus chesapeaki]
MASSVPAMNGFGDSAFSYDPAAAPQLPPTGSQQQQQPATQSPFHTASPPTQKDGTANALGFGAPGSAAIPAVSGSGAASAAPGSERVNDSIYIDFDILGDGKTDPNELMKTLKEQLSNPEAPIHNGMFGVFADKAQLEDAPAASTKAAAPAGSVTGNDNTGANDQLALERHLAELELNDAKAQLEDLKKQLSDSVSAHQSSLTQLADARNKLDDSMGQVAKLEGELNRVKSQNKTLTTDLSNAKDMWMKESSRASKLQDELNTRDDQIAEDSRRMAEMSATNEALQRENAQLKKLFEGSEQEVAARARAAENSFGQQNESYFGGARTVPSTSRVPAAMASSLGEMVAPPQTDGYMRPPTTATTTAFTPTPTARLGGTSGSPMKTTTFQPPTTGTVGGGALLPHNVGSPATVERFRALIGAQEGVLYEDDILQIGVQSSYTCGMGEGQVSLYFGNKSSGALDGFAVELISGDDITLTAEEAVPTAIRAKQQIRLSMKVVCTKPTQQIPMMSMRFLLFDNTPRTLSLRLPILLSKFMTPVDIPNAGDFFSLWRHHTYHLSEQSAVVSITASFGCRDSLLALARSATLGGVLKLHSQLDANPNNLVLCGKFPADSPEGIQCFTLPNATVLVRIEVGTGPQHSGKARVAVRSSEPVVALAVRDDLLLAFAELPADAEPSDPNFESGATADSSGSTPAVADRCFYSVRLLVIPTLPLRSPFIALMPIGMVSKAVSDKFGRRHTYLRLSLTDKCNLRCQYCMPPAVYGSEPEEIRPPPSEYLTADEIVSLASTFVNDLGITKIRLTGGEPTIRSDFPRIVEGIAESCRPHLDQFGITTNGVLLARHLPVMRSAGLLHVNVSLDTLVSAKFPMISNRPEAYWERARRLIDTLRRDEDFRLKVNCVVMRGVNDDELLDFVELTREENLNLRFIEYMPFSGNNWGSGKLMLSKLEILNRIQDAVGADRLSAVEEVHPNSTVGKEYRVEGYKGTFGVISSMTDKFCGGCNRLRVSADGSLYNCLFSSSDSGLSLRDALRAGKPLRPILEESLSNKAWALGGRADMHELGSSSKELRNMMSIGG